MFQPAFFSIVFRRRSEDVPQLQDRLGVGEEAARRLRGQGRRQVLRQIPDEPELAAAPGLNVAKPSVSSSLTLQGRNQWKGSNRKQSARWQHISQLKASAFCIW